MTARTLLQLAADLAAGRTHSRTLVDECLARIADTAGEGPRVFTKVEPEKAIAAAEYHDRMRHSGAAASPFAGIPISIKDLFDVCGEVTTAGSTVLRDSAPASQDAISVARLRAVGFIPIGRTNMTEFAFSGLGLNPHYGTPLNPYDRGAARIPGGSSSGAAVSVTDGMAHGALGTDTGGSCRIPAALCGIVGFKPTARRVPLDGALPLSESLDSIGPLAPSVSCCAVLDAVLAGESEFDVTPLPVAGLRLAVPQTVVLDGMDANVAASFERALKTLANAGVRISEIPLKELAELSQINRKGGFAAPEAYAFHRARIATDASGYDPRVLSRIVRGKEQEAADYLDLRRLRADFQRRVDRLVASFDALLMPTVPVVAPRLSELQQDDAYTRINMLVLRNPAIINFLDGCAISLPCHRAGELPVGLMLAGTHGSDRRLLAIAEAVAPLVAPLSSGR
ncbi:MAG TPA: amidase [Povalibacter sp.]|nr:amidase [Povalibacter sp.]